MHNGALDNVETFKLYYTFFEFQINLNLHLLFSTKYFLRFNMNKSGFLNTNKSDVKYIFDCIFIQIKK